MTSYNPPVKGAEYIFYVSLRSQANTKVFQSNPTLASGDVKVSKDGGALANLTTLPAVTPASSKLVKVTVSATEMNADNVTVIFSDASGDQWCDLTVNIQTIATGKQFDNMFTPGTSTVMQLKQLVINNDSGAGLSVTGTAGDIVGDITGNLGGNVTGNVEGDVAGDLGGNVTGNVGGNVVGSVASVTAEVSANVTKIDNDSTAASNLRRAAIASTAGAAQTGTLSVTQMTTNLSEDTDDHYKGCIVVWTTGNLKGQRSVVTAYDGESKMLTYVQVTEAPANGDEFLLT